MDEFGRPTSSQEWSVAAYTNLICKTYHGVDQEYQVVDDLDSFADNLVIDFRKVMLNLPKYNR